MSEYSVLVTEPAEQSLDDAFSWISEHSYEAAVQWYEGIIADCGSLVDRPYRCAIAPESGEFGDEIRHLIVGRYRVLFRIIGKTVEILAIRHSARRFLTP
jgi:plasmid stabilization system protein ParE